MNIVEKRMYFINECKQYKYLQKKLNEYKYAVSHEQEIDKECIICEIGMIKKRLQYVDDILSKIKDDKIRNVIIDKHIKGHSKIKVSIDNEIDDVYMYEKQNKMIDEVMKLTTK